MQVTRAGEYAILGLICLARHPQGTVVMIDELSRECRISKSFLAKIFQSLARAGIVRSNRGTRGGFILAMSPKEVTTLQVIEAVEGPIALQRCTMPVTECPQIGDCPLCGVFTEAQTQVRGVFSQTTLADLLARRPQPAETPAVAEAPQVAS